MQGGEWRPQWKIETFVFKFNVVIDSKLYISLTLSVVFKFNIVDILTF